MARRSGSPDTAEDAPRVAEAERDERIAPAKWRLGYARKSVLRNRTRKHLALLEAAKASLKNR